jgi:hypothetical protein
MEKSGFIAMAGHDSDSVNPLEGRGCDRLLAVARTHHTPRAAGLRK